MQLERAQSAKQPQSMPPATRGELEKAVEIAREIRTRERFNKLDFYDPYPYQQNFHETGSEANQRLLMAATSGTATRGYFSTTCPDTYSKGYCIKGFSYDLHKSQNEKFVRNRKKSN